MVDPFADLLAQFKGGGQSEPKTEDQKNKPLDAQYSGNVTRETTSSLSSVPVVTGTNSNNDDDFEELFGIKSSTDSSGNDSNNRPTTTTATTTNRNDFDLAFDLLQVTPEKKKQDTEQEIEPPLIDEVRDMEVAKLMSLGYSIDGANASYEQGVLYENVLEERERRKLHKRKMQRQQAEMNWEKENLAPRNVENGTNNGDLLSIASGIFNKGKKLVDQFTLFPDEDNDELSAYRNERLKQRQTFEPELPRRPRKSPTPNQDIRETQKPQPEGQTLDGDLLGDFQDKLSLEQSQRSGSQPAAQPQASETLIDFDEPSTNSTSTSVNSAGKQAPSTIPAVPITEIELSGYNEYKDRAGELFKAGDYVAASQEYEKSANTLPHRHPLRVISYSNLIASQLKIGQYKESLNVASMALDLFPGNTKQWTQLIQNSQPPRAFRDMWPKIVQRRAEAFEHLENYQDAFNTYQSLLENNFSTNKVLDGKRRCQKVLNPEKAKVVPRKPVPTQDRSPSPKNADRVSENLQKVKEENVKKAEEESQRQELYDSVYEQIKSWESGKPNDIRHLLSNIQTVVTWVDWKPVSTADLVMPKKVKVTYLKAIAKTHPDKVPDSLSLDKKMIAENVFSTLSTAWEKFKSENGIN